MPSASSADDVSAIYTYLPEEVFRLTGFDTVLSQAICDGFPQVIGIAMAVAETTRAQTKQGAR
jgi:hypothetical protein